MKTISAMVKTEQGIPKIFLDGKPVTGNLFFLNGDTLDFSEKIYAHELTLTAGCGFHAYTTNLNLDYDTAPGLTERHRKILDSLLDADPDAVFLIRVNSTQFVDPSDTRRDCDRVVLDGKAQSLISIASQRWAEETEARLRALASQLREDERYAGHVIGYHLEWLEWMQPQFYLFADTGVANTARFREFLKCRYGTDEKLSLAWGDSVTLEKACIPADLPMDDANRAIFLSRDEQRYTDYLDHMGQLTAGRIERFARALKEETDGDSLVISFYGYYFEIYHASAGHFALRRLLNSPWLDGFASPDSYTDRCNGRDARISCGGYMTAVDSVVRAGKLWISESDQRTFINRLPEPQDTVSYPPLADIPAITEMHRRAVGMAMVHGTSLYPMELTGCGWYDDIDIWRSFTSLDRDMAAYRSLFPGLPQFKTALVIDERANAHTGCSRMSAQSLSVMLHNFYRSGTRFALLELQDVLNGGADDISFFVFCDPFCLTAEDVSILEKRLHRAGTTAVYLNSFGITPPEAVTRLTGIEFRVDTAFTNHSLKAGAAGYSDEESFEMSTRTLPVNAEEELAFYPDGAAGLVRHKGDGWCSVFCGTPAISVANLRQLLRESGAEVLDSTENILTGNTRMVVFLSTDEEEKVLHFAEKTAFYDDRAGIYLDDCDTYRFRPTAVGEVRWLFFGDSAAVWRDYRNGKK